MRLLSFATIALLFSLFGCTQQITPSPPEIGSFIDVLKENGVDGSLDIQIPTNSDMEYVANYVISAYTSTRILSFFKFTSEERADFNLGEAMKNPKLTGQARNGTLLMAATFYPPDEEAVDKIRELFLAHKFN